jgi:DNA-binding transcriptional ArsR family regulator
LHGSFVIFEISDDREKTMLTKLQYGRERAAFGNALLNTVRIARDLHMPALSLGEVEDLIFVCTAVLCSHAYGRPATAASLSRTLELPRATVGRKLRRLIELGLVERDGPLFYCSERASCAGPAALKLQTKTFKNALAEVEEVPLAPLWNGDDAALLG